MVDPRHLEQMGMGSHHQLMGSRLPLVQGLWGSSNRHLLMADLSHSSPSQQHPQQQHQQHQEEQVHPLVLQAHQGQQQQVVGVVVLGQMQVAS